MSDADLAQLIAASAVLALVLTLGLVGRRDAVVEKDTAYEVPAPPDPATPDTQRTLARFRPAGTVVPPAEVRRLPAGTPMSQTRRSWLSAIIVGKDNRVSTSKTIAFMWTMAVAFGLLSLLVAVWLGDHAPWDRQEELGLQEEYLLLLGGPYTAAIVAKVVAVNRSDIKSEAPVGGSAPAQLINDDEGSTDLGDFQYVLFNLIALAYFLGDFIGDAENGFPVLPATLTGLALTSAAGYTAKKLIAQARPKLISVIPTSGAVGTPLQVFGTSLVVPASVSSSGGDLPPLVTIASHQANVTGQDTVLGNDRLMVTVPDGVELGSAPMSVARADGVVAVTSTGGSFVAFDVIPDARQ